MPKMPTLPRAVLVPEGGLADEPPSVDVAGVPPRAHKLALPPERHGSAGHHGPDVRPRQPL